MFCEKRSNFDTLLLLKIYNLKRCTENWVAFSTVGRFHKFHQVPKNEKLSTKEPLGLLLILFWEPFRYFPPLNINRLSFYNENTPFERLSLLSLFIFSARVVFLFWRGGKENNSLCLLKVRLWGFSIFFQIGTTATIALIPIHVRSHSRSLDPMILLSFCCVAWLYIYSIPYKLSLTF